MVCVPRRATYFSRSSKSKNKVRGLAAYEMTPICNATSHAFSVIEAEIAERDPFGDVNQVKPRRGGGMRDTTDKYLW